MDDFLDRDLEDEIDRVAAAQLDIEMEVGMVDMDEFLRGDGGLAGNLPPLIMPREEAAAAEEPPAQQEEERGAAMDAAEGGGDVPAPVVREDPEDDDDGELIMTPRGVEMKGFSCMVCYDSFNTKTRIPKVFQCGHSFCIGCVTGLLKARSVLSMVVNCPTCRANTRYSTQSDPKKVPTNYSILAMLEQRKEELMQSDDSTRDMSACFECNYFFSGLELTMCNHEMCQPGVDGDQLKAVDSLRRPKALLICQACIGEKHSRHNYIPLEKVAAQYEANNRIVAAERVLKTGVQHADDALVQLGHLKNEILEHRRRMVNALENVRDQADHPYIYEYLTRFTENVGASGDSFRRMITQLKTLETMSQSRYYRAFGLDVLRPLGNVPENLGPRPIKREPRFRGFAQREADVPRVPPRPFRFPFEREPAVNQAAGDRIDELLERARVRAARAAADEEDIGMPLGIGVNLMAQVDVAIAPAGNQPAANAAAPAAPVAPEAAPAAPAAPVAVAAPDQGAAPVAVAAPDQGAAPVAAQNALPPLPHLAAIQHAADALDRAHAAFAAQVPAPVAAMPAAPPGAIQIGADRVLPIVIHGPPGLALQHDRIAALARMMIEAAVGPGQNVLPAIVQAAPLPLAADPAAAAPVAGNDAAPAAAPAPVNVDAPLAPFAPAVVLRQAPAPAAQPVRIAARAAAVPPPAAAPAVPRIRQARMFDDLFGPPGFLRRGVPRRRDQIRAIAQGLQDALNANPLLAEFPVIQNAIDALQEQNDPAREFAAFMEDDFPVGPRIAGRRRRGLDHNEQIEAMNRELRELQERLDVFRRRAVPAVPRARRERGEFRMRHHQNFRDAIIIDPLVVNLDRDNMTDDEIIRAEIRELVPHLMEMVRNEARGEAAIADRPPPENFNMPDLLNPEVRGDPMNLEPDQVEPFYNELRELERNLIQQGIRRRARMGELPREQMARPANQVPVQPIRPARRAPPAPPVAAPVEPMEVEEVPAPVAEEAAAAPAAQNYEEAGPVDDNAFGEDRRRPGAAAPDGPAPKRRQD